jgi:hypothetical protein
LCGGVDVLLFRQANDLRRFKLCFPGISRALGNEPVKLAPVNARISNVLEGKCFCLWTARFISSFVEFFDDIFIKLVSCKRAIGFEEIFVFYAVLIEGGLLLAGWCDLSLAVRLKGGAGPLHQSL